MPLRRRQPQMEYQPAFHSQKVTKRTNYYSYPSRVGKLSGIMVRMEDRFTALYRKYQTDSCTGPENASISPLAMGPSPDTSKDSVSNLQTTADVGKYEISYTMQRDVHLLYHITTRNQTHNL
ncbi:hypothetical protein AVEN_17349-1 [Araneus ventricosus]|uniref:Uncharacterized protein n=1 Tax=Araneus ventricosus TaxID=182803 RepID=A0A4Y2PIU1_ARAVE|nr:hypothetical protein AVEN_17349-1 [Araneus ventricosus]